MHSSITSTRQAPVERSTQSVSLQPENNEQELYCRKYIWGICDRLPTKCKFKHVRDTYYMKKVLKFCHDYQNNACKRRNCIYLHTTKEEEILFLTTGALPQNLSDRYAKLESKMMLRNDTVSSSTREPLPQAMLPRQDPQPKPSSSPRLSDAGPTKKPGVMIPLEQCPEPDLPAVLPPQKTQKKVQPTMDESASTEQQCVIIGQTPDKQNSAVEDSAVQSKLQDEKPTQNSHPENSAGASRKHPLLKIEGSTSPRIPDRKNSTQSTLQCSVSSNSQNIVRPQLPYVHQSVPPSMPGPSSSQINRMQNSLPRTMHGLMSSHVRDPLQVSQNVLQSIKQCSASSNTQGRMPPHSPYIQKSTPTSMHGPLSLQINHIKNSSPHTVHGRLSSGVQGPPPQMPQTSAQPAMQCSVLWNTESLTPQLPYMQQYVPPSMPSQHMPNLLPQTMHGLVSEVQDPIPPQVPQNSAQPTMQCSVSWNTQSLAPPQLPYMHQYAPPSMPLQINDMQTSLPHTMHGLISEVQDPIPPQMPQNSGQPTMQCSASWNAQGLVPPQVPYIQQYVPPAMTSQINHRQNSLPHTMHSLMAPEVQDHIPPQVPQNLVQPTMQGPVSWNGHSFVPPQLPYMQQYVPSSMPTQINHIQNPLPHTMHDLVASEALEPSPIRLQLPQNSVHPTMQCSASSNPRCLIPPQLPYMQNRPPSMHGPFSSHINPAQNSLPHTIYGLISDPITSQMPATQNSVQLTMQDLVASQIQGSMPPQLPHMQNSLQLTMPTDSAQSTTGTMTQVPRMLNTVPPMLQGVSTQVQNIIPLQMRQFQNWVQPTMQGPTSSQIQGETAQICRLAPNYNSSGSSNIHDSLSSQIPQGSIPPQIQRVTPTQRPIQGFVSMSASSPHSKQAPVPWQSNAVRSVVPQMQVQVQSQVLGPMASQMQGYVSTQAQGSAPLTPLIPNATPQQIPSHANQISNQEPQSQLPGQALARVQRPIAQVQRSMSQLQISTLPEIHNSTSQMLATGDMQNDHPQNQQHNQGHMHDRTLTCTVTINCALSNMRN